MRLRYEIVDRCHIVAEVLPECCIGWRGQRFSTLERALRELAHAVPRKRFYVSDRETHLAHRADGTTINAWCYPAEASPMEEPCPS